VILSFFSIRVAEVFLAKTRPFSLWQQRATGIIVGRSFCREGCYRAGGTILSWVFHGRRSFVGIGNLDYERYW